MEGVWRRLFLLRGLRERLVSQLSSLCASSPTRSVMAGRCVRRARGLKSSDNWYRTQLPIDLVAEVYRAGVCCIVLCPHRVLICACALLFSRVVRINGDVGSSGF